MKLILPDGSSVLLPAPEGGDHRKLADWLAAQGHPLNTRCGGRGLCRGCEVVFGEDGDGAQRLKACQCSADTTRTTIRIPRGSLADRTLSGVSVFDLRIPNGAPRRGGDGLGLALDIGTTTLAAALWDLASGACLATATAGNPQRRYGDDVLSRISYSLDHPSASEELQQALVEAGLCPLIETVAEQAKQSGAAITRAVATGNPTMLQSLAGVSLAGLGRYPFSLAWSGEQRLDGTALGLPFACALELPPALGPFVGADVLAGALAAGMLEDTRPTLLVDFGTNGELLLLCEGRAYATATAAGPAFEGGRLSCGTTATARSISALELRGEAWVPLGSQGRALRHADGISGAAYIDFLAFALESGLINPFGRFDRVRLAAHQAEYGDEPGFTLLPGCGITEPDIAELMQAKAAVGAGISVLLETAGLAAEDLALVRIAGGFGYHLRPRHARRIGLLPDLPDDRFETIGNASLGGASLLLHYALDGKIESLRERCQVVELNQCPSFAEHYTDALLLERHCRNIDSGGVP